MLVQERVRNTITRRYYMDAHHKLQITEEEQMTPMLLEAKADIADKAGLEFLPVYMRQSLRDFFLPTGFPDTVSDDYLQYMLWQLPTNLTGWICSTLVTSSLLRAVGVDAWPGSTVAATAAIKWVTKDGLGSLGRLFIGGRYGGLFDDDPKQWRLYAELIGSFGSVFELATPILPHLFLPLASLGNLTKALGRGLRDPSFRVIQNHFAVAGNMGEVAAKEEVWEVIAELVGIAIGVVLLATPGLAASYSTLIFLWASIRSLHLWFRYQSLTALRFPTINFKRAFIMAESHVAGCPIPGLLDCNNLENLLFPWQFSRPYVQLGCSLKDAVGSQASVDELQAILRLYMDEQHVLVLHSNVLKRMGMRIVFKEGATGTTILRSMWQVEWLMASTKSPTSIAGSMFSNSGSCTLSNQMSILTSSLQELNSQFDSFLHEIEHTGWDTSKIVLKVPVDAPFLATTFPKYHHCKHENTK